MQQDSAAIQNVHEERPASPVALYGTLLQMMCPRARAITICAPAGAVIWASGLYDADALQRDILKASTAGPSAGHSLAMHVEDYAGLTHHAFTLRSDQNEIIAIVTIAIDTTTGRAPGAGIIPIVAPVLESLSREMTLRATVNNLITAARRTDANFAFLLAETNAKPIDADAETTVSELLSRVSAHMGGFAIVLDIPEHQFYVARYSTTTGRPDATEILARTQPHLLTSALARGRVLIANGPGSAAAPPACRITSVPVRRRNGSVNGFLAVYRHMTSRPFAARDGELLELLSHRIADVVQAGIDPTTGLAVRSAFVSAARRHARTAGSVISIIYIDIDQMHVTNENFGIATGDEVIAKVGAAIRGRAEAPMVAGRLAGDRFAILLPDTDMSAAALIGEELRVAMNAIVHLCDGAAVRVGVSMGVAEAKSSRENETDINAVLAEAETACRAAKDRGRNRVEVFEVADESVVRRFEDVHRVLGIREAIESNRYVLYAQKIAPLSNMALPTRYELLLRLVAPDGAILTPASFMSAAERYQLMPAIDQWVIINAFKVLGSHRAGIVDRAVQFSINLSAQALAEDWLVPLINSECARAQIEPSMVCFELTEAAAVRHIARSSGVMEKLREDGFSFALDDFGKGESSLFCLKSLPVTTLKVDGSFVRDALSSARSAAVMRSIADLGRTLDMVTVAEYVETEPLRDLMRSLGVDYAQGYCVAKPKALEECLDDIMRSESAMPGAVRIDKRLEERRTVGRHEQGRRSLERRQAVYGPVWRPYFDNG